MALDGRPLTSRAVASAVVGHSCDLLVVGGGPAGAAAALGLRRAGASVLVLESRRMPRDKPCGDLLGTQALALLADLGLDGELLQPFPPRSGFGLHVAGRRPRLAAARSLDRRPRVVPRAILDHALLELAVQAGAEVRWERVEHVVEEGATVMVQTEAEAHQSHLVVGADGWRSVVGRSLFGQRHSGQVGVAGRAYVHDPRGFESRMHVFYEPETRPGYGWLFPIDETHANVGVGVLKGEARLPGLFRGFLHGERSPLRRLLSDEASISGERTWPLALGWTARRRAGGRALLAGDAASLVGPLTGAGIHSALRSGLWAAATASAALRRPDERAVLLRRYERACSRWFRARLEAERVGQRVLSAPGGAEALHSLLGLAPPLDSVWTRVLFSLG
jgi:geranylgeranyl reductase family protein